MHQNHYPPIAVVQIQNEEPPLQAALFVNGVYIKGAGMVGTHTGEVYQMANALSGALREPVAYTTIRADEIQGETPICLNDGLGYAEAFGVAYRQGRFASIEESSPEVARNKAVLRTQIQSAARG
ncbi:hypothetical protein [Thioalkalivibrio sp. ALE16]|uniref:hypothetical protein n=1 Tax=Thioalkalivibrio sp. ALE16 TaxID=1158172 RepID=UPI000378EADE|nr:hypothetical protein [Thioalkalivibrio sp. ALE16]